MSNDINWNPLPLDPADERLIIAYVNAGRSLDDLPYTREFHELVSQVSGEDSMDERHRVFKRLLTLRKQGRLPRVAPRTVKTN